MQKIKMSRGTLLTFEEGCNKYLENCRQRNLREGTIGHYKQSYRQIRSYQAYILYRHLRALTSYLELKRGVQAPI